MSQDDDRNVAHDVLRHGQEWSLPRVLEHLVELVEAKYHANRSEDSLHLDATCLAEARKIIHASKDAQVRESASLANTLLGPLTSANMFAKLEAYAKHLSHTSKDFTIHKIHVDYEVAPVPKVLEMRIHP